MGRDRLTLTLTPIARAAVIVAALLAWAAPAAAWIEPNGVLFTRLAERVAAVGAMRLEGRLSRPAGAADGAAASSAATLVVESPGVLRLERGGAEQARGTGLLWPAGVAGTALAELPLPPGLLVRWQHGADAPPGRTLAAALEAAGVDLATRSLARFEDRVVVIVGALPWEGMRPQLWIDRERGAPVRLIVHEALKTAGPLWDIRLRGTGADSAGDVAGLAPARFEAWRDGVLVARFDADAVEVLRSAPAAAPAVGKP
jgi:hypothetical protein